MATAEQVKNQLQSLLDQANAATGKADTDLTAAVASLVEGQGGATLETCTLTFSAKNNRTTAYNLVMNYVVYDAETGANVKKTKGFYISAGQSGTLGTISDIPIGSLFTITCTSYSGLTLYPYVSGSVSMVDNTNSVYIFYIDGDGGLEIVIN